MALKTLLKIDEEGIRRSEKKIAINYPDHDPDIINEQSSILLDKEKILGEAKEKSATIEADANEYSQKVIHEAEHKAKSILKEAEQKRDEMLGATHTETDNYVQKEREALELEKKSLKSQKETQATELENYKEQLKPQIRQELSLEVQEEVRQKTEEEMSRLLNQVHEILNQAIVRRREILAETEKEISELVLLIARKVVKVIAEQGDNVVVQNVIQALQKLKGREKFHILVNFKNFAGLESFIPKIKEHLEIKENITVAEDTKVDVGGCIIETEFGEVDARISTQIAEIEKRIRDTEYVQNITFK